MMQPPAQVMIVFPAYNAARTVTVTLAKIPHSVRESAILVLCDDASQDGTAAVAEAANLVILKHQHNAGYGANQKTLYRYALQSGCPFVIMLHPDDQYDPSVLPQMIAELGRGADLVLGNRMHRDWAKLGGMPWWRRAGNRFLTILQQRIYRRPYGEFHTGLRAYRTSTLRDIPFDSFSDNYVFDSEMLASFIARSEKIIKEIPVHCRYHAQASSPNFRRSVHYGLSTLSVMFRYLRGRYAPH